MDMLGGFEGVDVVFGVFNTKKEAYGVSRGGKDGNRLLDLREALDEGVFVLDGAALLLGHVFGSVVGMSVLATVG
jgi:hypothetical protein